MEKQISVLYPTPATVTIFTWPPQPASPLTAAAHKYNRARQNFETASTRRREVLEIAKDAGEALEVEYSREAFLAVQDAEAAVRHQMTSYRTLASTASSAKRKANNALSLANECELALAACQYRGVSAWEALSGDPQARYQQEMALLYGHLAAVIGECPVVEREREQPTPAEQAFLDKP